MRNALLIAMIATLSAVARAETPAQTTWPTLHNDYQRSGYTDEVLTGPFERKWYRDFHDEMIATRVEAIVAEGKVFVGTFAGKLRALDIDTGRTVWTFDAAGPIGASPSYHDGKLYIGCDEAFDRGWMYCLRASDGETVWQTPVDGGVWVNPACDGEKVYFGTRTGTFQALDAETGKPIWQQPTGGMILKPASLSRDGKRILVGSEDMHVYCFSPDGKRLWKSEKLPGLSLRDQGATIWQDRLVVRTNPTDGFHEAMHRQGEVLEAIQRAIPLNDQDKVLLDKWGDYMLHNTPRRRKAEQEGIVEYLKKNPHEQTFHTLDLATGKRLGVSPIFYTGGLHNPPTPPAVNPETGELYTLARTALTYYLRGVRRYSSICKLDPETGMAVWHFPEKRHDVKRQWYGIPMIGDETSALSLMGNHLIVTHQGDIGAIDLETEKAYRIWHGRDTFGGIFGPKAHGGWEEGRKQKRQGYRVMMPNEWHGPDRAIVAIAAGRIFWVVGSQVVCLGGKQIPATASGGREPAPLEKTRLPLVAVGLEGPLETKPEPVELTVADVRKLVFSARPGGQHKAEAPTVRSLRDRLDTNVLELVEQGPWAPLAVQLGISKASVYFRRTAETMQTVALALPHLSPPVAAKAETYLHSLYRQSVPLGAPAWPNDKGKRREPFAPGPHLLEHAARGLDAQAGIADVYALYAYARATDRIASLAPLAGKLDALVADLDGQDEFRFDPESEHGLASANLNATISGLIGYVRIMQALDRDAQVRKGLELLVPRLAARIDLERRNRQLIRRQTNRLHYSIVPRYHNLTPELAAILGDQADQALRKNVGELTAGLPLWYQAYGERMIGGENYISPPTFPHGLFLALADGLETPPATLVRFVDQPWGRADLFYIDKLAAALRRVQGASPAPAHGD